MEMIKEKFFGDADDPVELQKRCDEAAKTYVGIALLIKAAYKEMAEPALMDWAKTVEITDDIREKYFVNYGTANGWDDADLLDYNVASAIHARDVKAHPELHGNRDRKLGRCYNEYGCKCGFSHSVDSSD